MSVAIRLNRQEEVKASLQGKAIGLSQLLRDELLRAGSAEREATVTRHEARALDLADELTAVMGALREYQ